MAVGPAYRSADATVSSYDAAAVTPSDSGTLRVTRALYVGVGGNLRVTMAYGTVVTFTGVLAGTVLPVQVSRVWATNTSATNIVAMY